MDHVDPDLNEPAPPPYTQQEFDSKVELARRASILDAQARNNQNRNEQLCSIQESEQQQQQQQILSRPPSSGSPPASRQPRTRPPRRPLPDPRAYAANRASLSTPQANTPPPRLRPTSDPYPSSQYQQQQQQHSTKERPSWYAEAFQGESAATSPSSSSGPARRLSGSASVPLHSPDVPTASMGVSGMGGSPPIQHIQSDNGLGNNEALLPAFEPIGPSLDGPAYSEAVEDDGFRRDPGESTVVPPPNTPPSPAPSNVTAVTSYNGYRNYFESPPHRSNQLISSTPPPSMTINNRPRSSAGTRYPTFTPPPPLPNNPYNAYNPTPTAYFNPWSEQNSIPLAAMGAINPSAFYNSSVSSVIHANQPQMYANPSFQDQRTQPSRPFRSNTESDLRYISTSVQHINTSSFSLNTQSSRRYPNLFQPQSYNPPHVQGYPSYNNNPSGYAS